jgi:hypothetical protein
MSFDINELVKTETDWQFCDKVFIRLAQHYGNEMDASRYKEEDMVVLLGWHAWGIIENGGFQYLFEGSFEGDPYFAKTAAAFKLMSAATCAEAFEEALQLFPHAKPPTNEALRLLRYQSVSETRREAIDDKFFSGSESVPTLLARFIRENRDAFAYLNEAGP